MSSDNTDNTLVSSCRYYLAHQEVKEVKGALVGGVVPNVTDGLLLKIMGRISKLNMQYAAKALSGTGLTQIEEFGILVNIRHRKKCPHAPARPRRRR
jgi:hypothetical protein